MASAPGLSPSRYSDFAQCPLLFRLRSIDKLEEAPQRATTLGTLVHSVLEHLYDEPASERTAERAMALVGPLWDSMVAENQELAALVPSSTDTRLFLDDAKSRVGTYFLLENPQRLEPEARELRLDASLEGGPAIRGVIDRVDVAPDGAVRVVDYKSGATPRAGYGEQAEFQMRFYAMLMERAQGVRPTLLKLLYLRDGGVKELRTTEADVAAVESSVRGAWTKIQDCAAQGEFPPKPSRLCTWCSFQSFCPEFKGTTPALDADAVEAATGVRPRS